MSSININGVPFSRDQVNGIPISRYQVKQVWTTQRKIALGIPIAIGIIAILAGVLALNAHHFGGVNVLARVGVRGGFLLIGGGVLPLAISGGILTIIRNYQKREYMETNPYVQLLTAQKVAEMRTYILENLEKIQRNNDRRERLTLIHHGPPTSIGQYYIAYNGEEFKLVTPFDDLSNYTGWSHINE